MLKDWALVSTFCHWGVEGGDFALKGLIDLLRLGATESDEVRHSADQQPLFPSSDSD